MCFTIFIMTSVVDPLKVLIQHSCITDETHLLGVSRPISSNGVAAPRATDEELLIISLAIVIFVFELRHHYLPKSHIVPRTSECRFPCVETRRLNRRTFVSIKSRSGI